MSNRDAWIQELKAGDNVITLYGRYMDPRHYGIMESVERTTKTQVILSSGSRFNRNTGLLVGSKVTGGYGRLVEATDDLISARSAYRQHQIVLERVRKVDLADLSTSQLSRIFDIIVEEY